MLSVGSQRQSGNELQTIGAATENNQHPLDVAGWMDIFEFSNCRRTQNEDLSMPVRLGWRAHTHTHACTHTHKPSQSREPLIHSVQVPHVSVFLDSCSSHHEELLTLPFHSDGKILPIIPDPAPDIYDVLVQRYTYCEIFTKDPISSFYAKFLTKKLYVKLLTDEQANKQTNSV